MKNMILNKSNLFSTRILTRISLLIALNIILSRFLGTMLPIAGFPTVKISFSHVPLFVAGILYGPLAGFICGFISDYLGSFIDSSGGGVFIPGFKFLFSFTSGLTGMIPALIFKFTYNTDRNFSKMNTIFMVFVSVCLIIVFRAKGVLISENIFFISLLCIVTLIFIYLPKVVAKSQVLKKTLVSFQKVYFAVNVTRIITSIFLNTYILSIMFGKGVIAFLPGRIVTNIIMIPLLSIVTTIIIDALTFEK